MISVTRSALPPPCRLDAKRLTSALSALEELTLELNSSSGDAVEKVLLIPTLKKLDLTVVSTMYCKHSSHVSYCLVVSDYSVLVLDVLCTSPSQDSVSDWHTSLHPKSQSGVAHLDLDLPSKGLAHSCSQMEELRIVCNSEGELL